MSYRLTASQMLSEHFKKVYFNRPQPCAVLRVQDQFSRRQTADSSEAYDLVTLEECFTFQVAPVYFRRFSLYRYVDIIVSPAISSHHQVSTVLSFMSEFQERLSDTRTVCSSIVETTFKPIDKLMNELLTAHAQGVVYYYINSKMSNYNQNALFVACIHKLRQGFDVLTSLVLLKFARLTPALNVLLEYLSSQHGEIFAKLFCLSGDEHVILSVLDLIPALSADVCETLRRMRFEKLSREHQMMFSKLLD